MPTPTQAQLDARLKDTGTDPASLIPSADLAAFQKANPGLKFDSQDLTQYASAGPVDVSALSGGTTPFTLPPAPTDPSFDIAGLPNIGALINPPATPTETAQDALGAEALKSTAKLGTKAAAQEAANEKYGVNQYTDQVNDIVTQLEALKVQNAVIPSKIQEEFAGRGATEGGVAPIQAGEQRKNFIESARLTTIGLVLQGKLASAERAANRAIEVEFGPEQAKLDYINKALEINEGKLTREESKRKDALTIQLAERQRKLDQDKEDKKIIYGWAAEAAKNGANTLMINRATAASTPAEALQILGGFLQDPNAKEKALADLAYTRAQTVNVKASTAATIASTKKTEAETAKVKLEAGGKTSLIDLLGQYRQAIQDTNWFSATFNPAKATELSNLKGQITAQYKKEAQLGTLDAGVQKLIDTIIPPAGGFSLSALSPKAQVAAIDNFITNQGGTAGGAAQTYIVNGKTYVKGADGLYYPK